MKVKAVVGRECPQCGEFILEKDLPQASEIRFQCGECEEFYTEQEEAKACCR